MSPIEKRYSILLVDDEEYVLKSLARALQSEPYRLFFAKNGREGLEALQREKIDLIVSDYVMPEMDGIEFLRRAREVAPGAMRIMLSGKASMDDAIRALNETEIYRFLKKPWELDDLRLTFTRALEFKKTREELDRYRNDLEQLVKERSSTLSEVNQKLYQEIKDRQQAEQELRRKEGLFRSVFDNIASGVLVTDLEERIILANSTARQLLGINVEDVGCELRAVIPQAADLLAKGRPVDQARLELETKDGRRLMLGFSNVIAALPEGECLITLFRDISQIRRVEERLADLNACLIGLGLDHQINIDSIVAAAGKILDADAVSYERLSDETLNIISRWSAMPREDNLLPQENDVCREVIHSNLPDCVVIAHLPSAHQTEAGTPRADGFMSYIGHVVRIQGRPEGCLSVFYRQERESFEIERHVLSALAAAMGTEEERNRAKMALRESEERYRRLADNAPDIIYRWDVAHGLEYISPAVEEIAGYSVQELLEQPFRGLELALANNAELINSYQQGLKDGVSIPLNELLIFRKDGSRVFLDVRTVLIKDESNNVIAFEGIIRDITARKQAEEEILELSKNLERLVKDRTKQLEEINKELEAFTYRVSHDLKVPLSSLHDLSAFMIKTMAGKSDPDNFTFLQTVGSSTSDMLGIIEGLLNLSRITKAEINLELVNLSEIVSKVAAELLKTNPDRKVDFLIEQGLRVNGDKLLLEIMIRNLLGNAVKYTKGQAVAQIGFGCQERNGQRVLFVRDNGVGFEMKYAEEIFKDFKRVHSPKEYSGLGIGLATVMRIIKRHGGDIWAESAPKHGATFYFHLPETATTVNEAKVFS